MNKPLPKRVSRSLASRVALDAMLNSADVMDDPDLLANAFTGLATMFRHGKKTVSRSTFTDWLNAVLEP